MRWMGRRKGRGSVGRRYLYRKKVKGGEDWNHHANGVIHQ